MRIHKKFTNTLLLFCCSFLLQTTILAQCPPGAFSSSNSTMLTVDTGVSAPNPNDGMTAFFAYFSTCSTANTNADAIIDVIYQGNPVEYTKDNQLSYNATNGTCEVKYNNPVADPAISNPLEIDFPSVPDDNCFYTAAGVLPVDLSRFSVTATEQGVLVEWETVRELNNDYFEIRHGTNHKEWEVIGEIQGAGTTEETVRYSFLDENPEPGDNYYLLNQTDYDGTRQMSQVAVVTVEGANNRLKIYPNPTSGNLTAVIDENADFPVEISVFDATGRLLSVQETYSSSETLDVSDLQNGFYYLQISDRKGTIAERFVKR